MKLPEGKGKHRGKVFPHRGKTVPSRKEKENIEGKPGLGGKPERKEKTSGDNPASGENPEGKLKKIEGKLKK